MRAKSKLGKIPEMTSDIVHDYMQLLGSKWTGQGVAMELGCWFGASSVPLLKGLVNAGYNLPYYAYDKWKANDQQIGIAKEYGIKLEFSQNLQPMFMRNAKRIYKNIVPVRGNIDQNIPSYPGHKIEICIFDAPKKDPTFSHCIEVLSPYWIPGVTVLGLLDYYFYQKREGSEYQALLAPVKFIEKNEDRFEKLQEWMPHSSCAFFKYKGGKLVV